MMTIDVLARMEMLPRHLKKQKMSSTDSNQGLKTERRRISRSHTNTLAVIPPCSSALAPTQTPSFDHKIKLHKGGTGEESDRAWWEVETQGFRRDQVKEGILPLAIAQSDTLHTIRPLSLYRDRAFKTGNSLVNVQACAHTHLHYYKWTLDDVSHDTLTYWKSRRR